MAILHSYSASFYGYYDDTKVHVLSDNSGYYVIQRYTDNIPHVLKYLFSSPNTVQDFKINGMYYYAVGTLMISDTELFGIITNTIAPRNAVFVKLTFASTPAASWAKQIGCSSGWNTWCSSTLLSLNKSKIYSLFSYQQSLIWNIYFKAINSSDGTTLGNSYRSSAWTSNPYVFGSVLNGDYLTATIICPGSTYLLIYNIPTDSFVFREFPVGNNLRDCAFESTTGR